MYRLYCYVEVVYWVKLASSLLLSAAEGCEFTRDLSDLALWIISLLLIFMYLLLTAQICAMQYWPINYFVLYALFWPAHSLS